MTFPTSPRARRTTSRRLGSDAGATAVEYALLVAGVALVMIVGVAFVGGSVGGGIATAAEALSVTATEATGVGASVVTEQEPTDQPTSEESAAANPTISCVGNAIARGRDSVAPTCDTSSGSWTCPRDYDLERVSGRGAGDVYTCEEDD